MGLFSAFAGTILKTQGSARHTRAVHAKRKNRDNAAPVYVPAATETPGRRSPSSCKRDGSRWRLPPLPPLAVTSLPRSHPHLHPRPQHWCFFRPKVVSIPWEKGSTLPCGSETGWRDRRSGWVSPSRATHSYFLNIVPPPTTTLTS